MTSKTIRTEGGLLSVVHMSTREDDYSDYLIHLSNLGSMYAFLSGLHVHGYHAMRARPFDAETFKKEWEKTGYLV